MITHTRSLFPTPPNVALISIRPNFVEKILAGEKRLEFRRNWAVKPVGILVIYSTAPIKRIVATVDVVGVTKGSPTALWEIAQEKGGGVTRKLIYDYFTGKKNGYAIEIGNVFEFDLHVDPKKLFRNFIPPQSFKYLHLEDYNMIIDKSLKRRA